MPPKLRIRQPPDGYRFSIDPLILAWHLAFPETFHETDAAHGLDIGTGCGVIPLLLARHYPHIRITAIEIQAPLAAFAAQNVRRNGFSERIRIENQDICRVQTLARGPADFITCNPPHTARAAGRINPDSQRAIARHEIRMALADLLAAASRLLQPGGRLFTIYPAARMAEVLDQMPAYSLFPQRRRMIHFKTDQPAGRFLVEAVKGASACPEETLPPLHIREGSGRYTPEALAVFEFAGLSNTGARL